MTDPDELRVDPWELGHWVLSAASDTVSAQRAARAVRAYLERKAPALAGALSIECDEQVVLIRAEGATAGQMLREAAQLLDAGRKLDVKGEIEVVAEEFAIELNADLDDPPEDLARPRQIAAEDPLPVHQGDTDPELAI